MAVGEFRPARWAKPVRTGFWGAFDETIDKFAA
jgi:hypothetical protein